MSDPVCFKTLIGMDFIGTVESEDDECYHMKNMFAISPQQNQQTQEIHISFSAAVHRSMGAVDPNKHGSIDVPLRKSAIVFQYKPNAQIEEGYQQAITGIQIARTLPGNMPRS